MSYWRPLRPGENAPVLSEPITLTTEKVNQGTTMEVTLAEGERTESTLSFTVTTANAAECRYRYFKKTEDFVLPDKYDIFATATRWRPPLRRRFCSKTSTMIPLM